MPPITFSSKQNEAVLYLQDNLNAYVNKMVEQFILGGADIDSDWEEYLKNLEALGLESYLSYYQNAYDLFTEE